MSDEVKYSNSIKLLTGLLEEKDKTIQELSTVMDEAVRRLIEIEGGGKQRPVGESNLGVV